MAADVPSDLRASTHPGNGDRDILKQYDCGPVRLPHQAIDSFRRHLVLDHMVELRRASLRQSFQAISRSIRDLLAQRWLKTKQTYHQENPKRVYYLSMEFLIGRSLSNNILNMMIDPIIRSIAEYAAHIWNVRPCPVP